MNTNASRSRAFHTSVVVGGQLDVTHAHLLKRSSGRVLNQRLRDLHDARGSIGGGKHFENAGDG